MPSLITIYHPQQKAKRIKLFVPYEDMESRAIIKKSNSSFYHPNQKLWSIINTKENMAFLKTTFKDKHQIIDESKYKSKNVPNIALSNDSLDKIDSIYHKPTQIAAHLILPNRTQSPPTTRPVDNGQFESNF